MTILARGAEAIIETAKAGVRKRRLPKRYRHSLLDARLREQRTRSEERLLIAAAAAGVRVPKVLSRTGDGMVLERIAGVQLRDVLDKSPKLARKVGTMLATLHAAQIIHGDLTTSNILVEKDGLVLLDFGLAFRSRRLEDMAVDMHVFLQSLASRHHNVEARARKEFLKGYAHFTLAKDVLARLAIVEERGRNKAR